MCHSVDTVPQPTTFNNAFPYSPAFSPVDHSKLAWGMPFLGPHKWRGMSAPEHNTQVDAQRKKGGALCPRVRR